MALKETVVRAITSVKRAAPARVSKPTVVR
jgi:hypothetical protein